MLLQRARASAGLLLLLFPLEVIASRWEPQRMAPSSVKTSSRLLVLGLPALSVPGLE